jgi:hypothetical protein
MRTIFERVTARAGIVMLFAVFLRIARSSIEGERVAAGRAIVSLLEDPLYIILRIKAALH